jgi:hypothetical protein
MTQICATAWERVYCTLVPNQDAEHSAIGAPGELVHRKDARMAELGSQPPLAQEASPGRRRRTNTKVLWTLFHELLDSVGTRS